MILKTLDKNDVKIIRNDTVIDNFLIDLSRWKGELIIVGGHFMLKYSHNNSCLVPMITEELKDPIDIKYTNETVGKFPSFTFRLACEIAHIRKDYETKIALLVNDHQFSRFQDLESDLNCGILRKNYFRENFEIPEVYKKILSEYGFSESKIIFRNDKLSRKGRGILPKNTPYFSEQNLRNLYASSKDKHKNNFLDQHLLLEKIDKSNLKNGNDVLIKDRCECSREVYQFIQEISPFFQDNNSSLLFIVPTPCGDPVWRGIKSDFYNKHTFTNVGEMYGIEELNQIWI